MRRAWLEIRKATSLIFTELAIRAWPGGLDAMPDDMIVGFGKIMAAQMDDFWEGEQ